MLERSQHSLSRERPKTNPGPGFYALALLELVLEVGGAGVDYVRRSVRKSLRRVKS